MSFEPGDIVEFNNWNTDSDWVLGLLVEIRDNPSDVEQMLSWRADGKPIPEGWPRKIADVLHGDCIKTCWYHHLRTHQERVVT